MIHLVKIAAALGFVTLGSILTSPTRTGTQYVEAPIMFQGRQIGSVRKLTLKRRKGQHIGDISRIRILREELANIYQATPTGSWRQIAPVDIILKSKTLKDVMFSAPEHIYTLSTENLIDELHFEAESLV